MLNDLRCVTCNSKLAMDGECTISCPACSATYPVVQGIPFLGHYCPDDFISLLELVAMAEAAPRRGVPDFALLDRACETFYQSGDEKRVREVLGDDCPWFPYRYSEWQMWRCLLRDMDLTGLQVLDVGAGEGFDAWRVQQRGAHVTALEYSAPLAALGKRNLPETRWLGGFAHILPFQDSSFDVIVCNAALHHMRDIPAAVSEFLRVLKPGGTLLTASDPFTADNATEETLLEIFNTHQAVLSGINENSPRLKEFLASLELYRTDLQVTAFSLILYGNDELGLPLHYARRWDLDSFAKFGSAYGGNLALRVKKRSPLAIPSKTQKEKWLAADEFDALCSSGDGVAALVSRYAPPFAYFNISTPHTNYDTFLQRNGWRLPVPDAPWQEGWGRANSYWRRGSQDVYLYFELEAPVHGWGTQVALEVTINGTPCTSETIVRGLRYAVYLDISAQAEETPFVVTIHVAEANDFDARIIRVYQQCFKSAKPDGATWFILGEGVAPGLAALLAGRFSASSMLHVLCLPGTDGLRGALDTIRSAPIGVRFYFPECMELAAVADIPDNMVALYKYDEEGIRDCLKNMSSCGKDILILLPESIGAWPQWLRDSVIKNIAVLSYKDNEIIRGKKNDYNAYSLNKAIKAQEAPCPESLSRNGVNSTQRPHILLYNPISGHGHLDGWHAMFASILLQRGHTVYCFTPDTAALSLRLRQKGLEQHPNLTILPLPAPHCDPTQDPVPLQRRYKDRIITRLRELRNTYVNRLEGSRITPDMPFPRRYKKRLAQLLIPPAYALFRTIRSMRPVRIAPVIGAAESISGTEAGYISPGEWGRRMYTTLQTLPAGQYFLFNMYMDMHKTDQTSWGEFARYCHIPWACLRFNLPPLPYEPYYDLPSMRGMCLTNETLCRVYAEALPEKRFVCLPDVAEAALPPVLPSAAQAILERAGGRKVVFMGGSIGGQKNIVQWRELIRRADPRRFFFVQIGEIHYGACSPEDQDILRDLADAPPENFFMLAEYLPDERDFNACIAASDVIFAVYKDFRNASSNMPGKAAAFGKSILVSDIDMMREVVQQYGLGAAVPEDEASAILAALEHLVQTPPRQENFAAYNAEHTEVAMGRVLERFIDACW